VSVLLSEAGPWANLGHPLAGSAGTPTFTSVGPLQENTEVEHLLKDAKPNGLGILVVAATSLDLPLYGGQLIPFPQRLMKMIFLLPQVLMRKIIMMIACLLFMMITMMKVGLEDCQL
jgi:hypothetical protein